MQVPCEQDALLEWFANNLGVLDSHFASSTAHGHPEDAVVLQALAGDAVQKQGEAHPCSIDLTAPPDPATAPVPQNLQSVPDTQEDPAMPPATLLPGVVLYSKPVSQRQEASLGKTEIATQQIATAALISKEPVVVTPGAPSRLNLNQRAFVSPASTAPMSSPGTLTVPAAQPAQAFLSVPTCKRAPSMQQGPARTNLQTAGNLNRTGRLSANALLFAIWDADGGLSM